MENTDVQGTEYPRCTWRCVSLIHFTNYISFPLRNKSVKPGVIPVVQMRKPGLSEQQMSWGSMSLLAARGPLFPKPVPRSLCPCALPFLCRESTAPMLSAQVVSGNPSVILSGEKKYVTPGGGDVTARGHSLSLVSGRGGINLH